MLSAMAVDPFKGKLWGKKTEKVKASGNTHDPAINAAIDLYEIMRHLPVAGNLVKIKGEDNFDFPNLDPQQLNLTARYILENDYYTKHAGLFITRLIKESYKHGHNGFHLDTSDHALDGLGDLLWGSKENRISLSVHGNVGNHFARCAEYLDAKVHGNAGISFGAESGDCFFRLYGNAQDHCANACHYNRFEIEGSIG